MWWTVTQALRYCSCSSSNTIHSEHVVVLDTDKDTAVTLLSTTTTTTAAAAAASPSSSLLQPWQSYRLYCVYLAVTTALLLVIVFLWVVQRVERARQRRALLRHMMTAATRTSRSRTTATMAMTAASTSTWLALYGVTFVRPATSSLSCSSTMYGGSVRDRCIICFAATALRPLALLPCGHCQMCARCVAALWRHGGTQQCLRCPLCRQRVDCVCPAILMDASSRNNNNDNDSNSGGSSRSNDDDSAGRGVGAVECRDDAAAAAAAHNTKEDCNDNKDDSNDDDDDDDDDDDKNTMSVADEVLFVREYNKRFRRRRRMRWLGGGGSDGVGSGDGSNVARTAVTSAATTAAAAAAAAAQVRRTRDVRTHTARTVRDHSHATGSDHDGDVVDAHDSDVCWHERCVRVLRCITNARYLPTIVAVRISLLHLTMIAFLLMPQDVLPTIYMPSSRSNSVASSSSSAVANTADTTHMPQTTTTTMTMMPVVTFYNNNNYTNVSSSNSSSDVVVAATDAATAPTAVMTACAAEVRSSANAVSAVAAATTMHDTAVLWLTCARQRVLRLLGVAVEAIMQCTDDVFLFVFCIVLLGHVLLRSLFDDAVVE